MKGLRKSPGVMQPVKDTTATPGFNPAKAYPVSTDGQAGKLTATFRRTRSQDAVALGDQGQGGLSGKGEQTKGLFSAFSARVSWNPRAMKRVIIIITIH